MSKIVLVCWVTAVSLCCYYGIIEPRMYVYDNHQNRGINPASWGEGEGTLRIHKLTGEIQKYCYDPAIIDEWYDWWEPIGKTSPSEKEEIINYFKQLQEAGKNASQKAPVPIMTLDEIIGLDTK